MPAEFFPRPDPEFEKFVAAAPGGNLAQTPLWGQIYAAHPDRRRAWAIGARGADGRLAAAGVFVRMRLPLGRSYLFAPLGPVWTDEKKLDEILLAAGRVARSENAAFLRVDPTRGDVPEDFWARRGFRFSKTQKNPRWNWVTDLAPGLEKIRAAMKTSGRRNLKIAEKFGVEIREIPGPDPAALEKFDGLLRETERRDGFFAPKKSAVRDLLAGLGPGRATLLFAEKNGEVLAAAFLIFCGETAVYLYGASGSGPAARASRATYFLHFAAMGRAAARGCRFYDWTGVTSPLGENFRQVAADPAARRDFLRKISAADPGEISPLEKISGLGERPTAGKIWTPEEIFGAGDGAGDFEKNETLSSRGSPPAADDRGDLSGKTGQIASASPRNDKNGPGGFFVPGADFVPDPGHPFAGISQFKTRFPGDAHGNLGAWDFEFSPGFCAGLDLAKKIRRALRR